MTPFATHIWTPPPEGGKTYVIGDVHGCGLELQILLNEVNFRIGIDRLILVGDLYDRAMHPELVWKIVHQYRAYVTKGNHEIKMEKIIRGTATSIPKHYVWCRAKMNENGISDVNLVNHIVAMPSLITLETEKVIVAHGGIRLDDPRKPDESANSYGSFKSDEPMPHGDGQGKPCWWDHYTGDHLVVYGHITNPEPRLRFHSIGIDTGACHGGMLTAYCVETGETHSVPAICDWFTKLRGEFDIPDDRPAEFRLDSTLKSFDK